MSRGLDTGCNLQMYNYTVIRTNRRNISIAITPNNEIVVRCNNRVSLDKIDKFVYANSAWIEKHLAINQKLLDSTESIREYKNVYILGELFQLQIFDKNNFDRKCLYVKSVKHINNVLAKLYGEARLDRVRELAKMMNVEPTELCFRKYKAKWACCDTQKRIVFSYATLMLSDRLFDYIAIHELCHIFYMNHSNQFKQKLSEFLPEWRNRRADLKYFSFLLKIY